MIGVALLGVAHPHSHAWMEFLSGSSRARPVCIWDADDARAKAFARQWNVPVAGSVEEALTRHNVDAVGICAETCLHAELVRLAAEEDKAVLCEKPMAFRMDDCNAIVEAVKKNGILYMQSFPKRLDPVSSYLKEVVGKRRRTISTIRIRHGHGFALNEDFRRTWFVDPAKAGYGAFLDEGIHAVDLMLWLMEEEPSSCTAKMGRLFAELEVDDHGTAIYAFEDLLVEVAAGWVWPAARACVEVFDTSACIITYGTDNASKGTTDGVFVEEWAAGGKNKQRKVHPVKSTFGQSSYQGASMETFIECIEQDKQPPSGVLDGRAAVKAVLAAYEAAGWKKKGSSS